MRASLFDTSLEENHISTAKVFEDNLVRLGAKYKNLIVLTTNSNKHFHTTSFGKVFPERYFTFGNSEQNILSAAAGLAVRGKIPFVCGLSLSLTGQGFEQIRNSICYPHLNVKIVGVGNGLFHNEGGGIYQALEDISLTRCLPHMKIFCPADHIETKKVLDAITNDFGPTYVRLSSQNLPALYSQDYQFEIGKGSIYKAGTDICIFTFGSMVHTALESAELLERDGFSTMVVNLCSLKPLDKNLIIECVKQAQHIVSLEDHSITGGLGSAIAEVFADEYPCKLLRLGMKGFGESGKVEDLYRKYNLDAQSIFEKIKAWIKE